MKKLITLCLACFATFNMHAQPFAINRIAVSEFKAGVGLNPSDVDGISYIFITYFRPDGYEIVERTQLEEVIREQNLQKSSITENDMVRVGKILNLTKIVLGNVNLVMGEYNVDVRVIDIETGAIAATSGISFNSSSYRKSMQSLAEGLSSRIAIKPKIATPSNLVAIPSNLTELYNNGAAALQNKQFAEAVTLLDKFLDNAMDSEDPNVLGCVPSAKKYIPVAYMNLGLRAASQRNYYEAVENLNNAVNRAKRYGEMQTQDKAKVALAKVYQVQGSEAFNNKDYAAAAEIFAKGYEADPKNTDMALNLAMSYCESGEYEKGMDVYRNIAALSSDRYADAVAKANEMMALYTNNEIARRAAQNH